MRRVEADPDYRPGNLITGKEGGLDEWVIHAMQMIPFDRCILEREKEMDGPSSFHDRNIYFPSISHLYPVFQMSKPE
jgi:hypothetical protein